MNQILKGILSTKGQLKGGLNAVDQIYGKVNNSVILKQYKGINTLSINLDVNNIDYTIKATVNTNFIATVERVRNDIALLNALVVHNTGNENIEGVKTFISSPIIPNPIEDYNPTTKLYVDNIAKDLEEQIIGHEDIPYVFDTYNQFISWLNEEYIREDQRTVNDLRIGNDVKIIEFGYPDYWCSSTTKPFTINNFTAYEGKNQFDSELSPTSENAVQNKVIYNALQEIQPALEILFDDTTNWDNTPDENGNYLFTLASSKWPLVVYKLVEDNQYEEVVATKSYDGENIYILSPAKFTGKILVI